jgi:hypothetical protein
MTAWIMFRMFVLAVTRAPSSFRAKSDACMSAVSRCPGCARSNRLLGVRRQRRMSNPSPAPAFDLRAFINRGAGLPPPQEPPASIPIDLGNNARNPFAGWPAQQQVGPLAIQYAAQGKDVEMVGESKTPKEKEKKKEGKETKKTKKGTKRKANDDDDGDEDWTASQDGQQQPAKKKQKKKDAPKTRKTAPMSSRAAAGEEEKKKDYKEALDLLELEYDELEDELDQANYLIREQEANLKETEEKLLEATTAACPILCTERNSLNKSVVFSACGHTTCIDCFKVTPPSAFFN